MSDPNAPPIGEPEQIVVLQAFLPVRLKLKVPGHLDRAGAEAVARERVRAQPRLWQDGRAAGQNPRCLAVLSVYPAPGKRAGSAGGAQPDEAAP